MFTINKQQLFICCDSSCSFPAGYMSLHCTVISIRSQDRMPSRNVLLVTVFISVTIDLNGSHLAVLFFITADFYYHFPYSNRSRSRNCILFKPFTALQTMDESFDFTDFQATHCYETLILNVQYWSNKTHSQWKSIHLLNAIWISADDVSDRQKFQYIILFMSYTATCCMCSHVVVRT